MKESAGHTEIAKKHLEGTYAMVELAGGPHRLGITGLLETIYNRFVTDRVIGDRIEIAGDDMRHILI